MNQHLRHRLPSWIFLSLALSLTAVGQAAGSCPAPATGAFTGCYYNNPTMSGDPVFVRTDPQINFYWGNSSPDNSLPPYNFSARWQGNFVFGQGNYQFSVITSDGMRLSVDGNVIIDRWRDQPPCMYTGSQTLSQGNHLVVVEYYEHTGGATAQVSWVNTSPGPQLPVISSFTAMPASTTPGQPVTLSWSISGATAISIDNGVGNVTSLSATAVTPAQTTTYKLMASNGAGSSTATVTVAVSSSPDSQPPSPPTLFAATASSPTEVDLAWTTSTDNVGVTGYQILRNGSPISTVTGSAHTYADSTVSPNSTYTYVVKAFDAAGNHSAASNSIQVTTPFPTAPPGSCPAPATAAFTGCYYNNMTLSGNPVFVRTDPKIDFYWGNSSPDSSLPPFNFSIRWQGNFTFNQGNYLFTVITSDGMRLYVDGNVVIDRWRDQAPFVYQGSQTLSQGSHLVVVEYYEHTAGATAQVSWMNTSPGPQMPVISSFTASPVSTTPGRPVTLSWSVSGAAAVSIDNGVGNVTNFSATSVSPTQTTTYKLTASNSVGASTATVTVVVSSSPPNPQPPTTPTLVSATASSPSRVDLVWTASTDNLGVTGYQVLRNGSAVGVVAGTTLAYADTTVSASSTYVYAVKAFDTAGNYSAASNSLSVTTPVATSASVTWYGACWQPATIFGVTGNFQAIDFVLTTPTPVPVQGTLFFAPNCDPSNGQDNMNDFDTPTGSTHTVQGFTHHPDEIPTSAYYWVGSRTADGKCAPGSPCSGCVNYTPSTPLCSTLP
jgi:chitodextrinase